MGGHLTISMFYNKDQHNTFVSRACFVSSLNISQRPTTQLFHCQCWLFCGGCWMKSAEQCTCVT